MFFWLLEFLKVELSLLKWRCTPQMLHISWGKKWSYALILLTGNSQVIEEHIDYCDFAYLFLKVRFTTFNHQNSCLHTGNLTASWKRTHFGQNRNLVKSTCILQVGPIDQEAVRYDWSEHWCNLNEVKKVQHAAQEEQRIAEWVSTLLSSRPVQNWQSSKDVLQMIHLNKVLSKSRNHVCGWDGRGLEVLGSYLPVHVCGHRR